MWRQMIKFFALLYIALNVLLPTLAHAMKPAPFEDREYEHATNEFLLQSKRNDVTDRYSTEGTTQLLDTQGKVLWSMPEFVGRRGVNISPDGKLLILSGNIYFGGLFQLSKDTVLATVFAQGKSIKQILFSDIFQEDPDLLARDLKVGVYGGGWVEGGKFIESIDVDWKQRSINYTLFNDTIKKIVF